MAQTNFTPILLYASSTPTNVPSAGNLTNSTTGSEIAINIADKNLFFKDSGGVVNTVPIRQSSTSSNGWLSATDWNTFNNKAPATSGTSILYGNGSGGFSNVTIGTGVSFVGGTLSATGTGGTVTSVTGTAPVVSSGGTTPAISMPAATTSVNGYLTSTDWNTFNSKQPAGTYVTSVAATSPVTSSGGTTPTIAMPAATTSVSGYLTSTDWNTFNNKQAAGAYLTAVSVVSGNGFAGTSSGGTTPALTLSTTVTGLLKGNGTAISAATSGTDYAPATSGSSILYGNGAGGFSNVTIGTGLTFVGGTLASTASGGTVTSVAATVPAFLSISGSPITTSGTLAISYSGTALPVANGGTGLTTLTAGYVPYGNGTGAFSSLSTFNFNGSTLSAPALSISGNSVLSASTGVAFVGNSSQLYAEKFQMYGNYAVFSDGTYTAFMGKGSSIGGGGTADFGIRSLGNLVFVSPGATEMARFTTNGNLLVGTTTDPASAKAGIVCSQGVNSRAGYGSTTTTTNAINFYYNGATVSLYVDTSNLGAITTVSDYRIKRNIETQSESGLEKILKLRPVTYQIADYNNLFKASNEIKEGFIAHEVQAVIPSGAEGQKDEENRIQNLRLDAILSVTVKALQELNTKFDAYVASHP